MNNNDSNTGEIVMYQPDETIRLEVRVEDETVWLTQQQMADLFLTTRNNVTLHIGNIFKEGELPKEGFMQILHKTSVTGGRPIAMYNLDVIISVGYRVKSFQGTRFRQWATRVLREMLLNRLDEIKRIAKLERRMDSAEGDIKQIKGGMSYLVQQLSAPQDPPRRRIGFGNDGDTLSKPYGKA